MKKAARWLPFSLGFIFFAKCRRDRVDLPVAFASRHGFGDFDHIEKTVHFLIAVHGIADVRSFPVTFECFAVQLQDVAYVERRQRQIDVSGVEYKRHELNRVGGDDLFFDRVGDYGTFDQNIIGRFFRRCIHNGNF